MFDLLSFFLGMATIGVLFVIGDLIRKNRALRESRYEVDELKKQLKKKTKNEKKKKKIKDD